MGWKDIFAKRRNEGRLPPLQRAARDAAEATGDRAVAALAMLRLQEPDWRSLDPSFVVGYLVGFAAQAAGTSRMDAETAVARIVSPTPGEILAPGSRAAELIGRHEAQCGTDRLLRLALDCLSGKVEPETVITACDVAADKLQTHDPQRNFRFTAEERGVLLNALRAGANYSISLPSVQA